MKKTPQKKENKNYISAFSPLRDKYPECECCGGWGVIIGASDEMAYYVPPCQNCGGKGIIIPPDK